MVTISNLNWLVKNSMWIFQNEKGSHSMVNENDYYHPTRMTRQQCEFEFDSEEPP